MTHDQVLSTVSHLSQISSLKSPVPRSQISCLRLVRLSVRVSECQGDGDHRPLCTCRVLMSGICIWF